MLTRFRVTLLTGATVLAYAPEAAHIFEAVKALEPFQDGPYFIDVRQQDTFDTPDMSLSRHYLTTSEGVTRFQLAYLLDWKAKTCADILRLTSRQLPVLDPIDFKALAEDPDAVAGLQQAIGIALQSPRTDS